MKLIIFFWKNVALRNKIKILHTLQETGKVLLELGHTTKPPVVEDFSYG